MLSTRQIVLSKDEVCEAVKAFVRSKYHEKIEKGYILQAVKETADENFSFTFGETLDPFVKSPKVIK
jgi:hypothetical protein